MRQHDPTGVASEIRVTLVEAEEQNRRVSAATAQRAYEIFEQRGGAGWHELEDWRQAEKELGQPSCVGLTTEDHTMVVDVMECAFEPGTVELWVAPLQITISGRHLKAARHGASRDHTPAHLRTYRTISLHAAIDPRQAKVRYHNTLLEICLPLAQAREAAAAMNVA